jgi:hypothetical protein
MIGNDAVVGRAEGLMSAPVDGDIVFLNPGTDSYVALDAIGRRIWELLDPPLRVGELMAALTTEFNADASVVAADVAAFLAELQREGMLRVVEQPAVG